MSCDNSRDALVVNRVEHTGSDSKFHMCMYLVSRPKSKNANLYIRYQQPTKTKICIWQSRTPQKTKSVRLYVYQNDTQTKKSKSVHRNQGIYDTHLKNNIILTPPHISHQACTYPMPAHAHRLIL